MGDARFDEGNNYRFNFSMGAIQLEVWNGRHGQHPYLVETAIVDRQLLYILPR